MDFSKLDGLIPAVVQDQTTGDVLMVGFMNEEALEHGQPTQTMAETLVDAEFWYESLQNWQSEFLSIAVLLVLGIYLRERGSPESKPVAAPHAMTGH